MPLSNSLLLYILIFPLLGFLINGILIPLRYKSFSKAHAPLTGGIATTSVALSFATALVCFLGLGEGKIVYVEKIFDWLNIANLNIPFELRMDALNAPLILIITGVGTLIHLYSIGYMSHEEGVGRYFSYLNLFCFSMLLLVMGNNILLLFFGWEGVGLCSYLLIGYWYTDTIKANAGKKAFIVNRIGDLGFLIGMFLIFKHFGTLSFTDLTNIFRNPENKTMIEMFSPHFTLICICLFIGATGKSAQIPLFVWLPDAMSGPTPVSALIHAATMVTAGVYMLARLNFMFDLSPIALSLVANVGAITALFAGTIAIAQFDIKKVLAYSTVSQLGFMFLAAGLGAYQTAVFHLMTHAFFKALLFLGSGSVIHACSGEQDMRKMGGLKKYLPHTYLTMMVGSAAIAGLPFFSGFFSKDEIIYSALALPGGGTHLYVIGMLTAFITAVYTTRMMVITFFGESRLDHHAKEHLHESPWQMLVPLYVLAILAALGGFLGVPHILGDYLGHFPHILSHWLDSVVPTKIVPVVAIHSPRMHEAVAMAISVATAIIGIMVGFVIFTKNFSLADWAKGLAPVQKLLENKYYVDETYDKLIVRPLNRVAKFFWSIVDVRFIDGTVLGIGKGIRDCGLTIKRLQTSDVQVFAYVMGLGLMLISLVTLCMLYLK